MTELVDESVAWMDEWFDPDVGLLWNMEGAFDEIGPARSIHIVPQNGWYCLGLAHRDGPGDRARIAHILEALVQLQYRSPGAVWDGTFARFLEWPTPPAEAVEWEDYDPNWRQFLGTSLTMLLRHYPEMIDPELRARVESAIRYAVAGEPPERIRPSYTNIALKVAWLDVEWGHRARGERLAEAIWRKAVRNGAFDEFNSPTYDGIALWGLSLWRGQSSSAALREWGTELEALLWRNVGERYHAGLRNMAGPYNRAYGMDMERTFSQLGLWIAEAVGRDRAPLPDVTKRFDHSHDFSFTPLPALVGTVVPDDVVPHLESFQGERRIETVLEAAHARRVATAWLSDDVMIGAEAGTIDWGGWEQHHLATAHWRTPNGTVAWLRVRHPGPSAATAEAGALRIAAPDVIVDVGGVDGVDRLEPGPNLLPGCTVDWRRTEPESVLELHVT